jgi:hypothetical protein
MINAIAIGKYVDLLIETAVRSTLRYQKMGWLDQDIEKAVKRDLQWIEKPSTVAEGATQQPTQRNAT